MEKESNEWLSEMYQNTLDESRYNTFKRFNSLCWILMIMLFINLIFTPPSNIINTIITAFAVCAAIFMFWYLTKEKSKLNTLPLNSSEINGDDIRTHINQIRENQHKLRKKMMLFTIPFFIYFAADLFFSASIDVDKVNLTLKMCFFLFLIMLYYFLFLKIRKTNQLP